MTDKPSLKIVECEPVLDKDGQGWATYKFVPMSDPRPAVA